nr:hypothetical protein [Desulfobacula sp.]
MKMEKDNRQSGFTLIEILIAILLLIIGILGVGVMQNTSIEGNNTANNLTAAATWGSDALETLMARSYTHDDLTDDNNDGMAGLDNTNAAGSPADGGPIVQGNFTTFWNIADNYPVFATKTIRVIVLRRDEGRIKAVNIDFIKTEPI